MNTMSRREWLKRVAALAAGSRLPGSAVEDIAASGAAYLSSPATIMESPFMESPLLDLIFTICRGPAYRVYSPFIFDDSLPRENINPEEAKDLQSSAGRYVYTPFHDLCATRDAGKLDEMAARLSDTIARGAPHFARYRQATQGLEAVPQTEQAISFHSDEYCGYYGGEDAYGQLKDALNAAGITPHFYDIAYILFNRLDETGVTPDSLFHLIGDPLVRSAMEFFKYIRRNLGEEAANAMQTALQERLPESDRREIQLTAEKLHEEELARFSRRFATDLEPRSPGR